MLIGNQAMKNGLAVAMLFLATLAPSAATEPDTPTTLSGADLAAAAAAFEQWTAAFQSGDYGAQWRLTDPRIRYWKKQDRFDKAMTLSVKRHGGLIAFTVTAVTPVTAAQLPCTEQGHCFRKNVDYVLIVIRSTYRGKPPPQPEFAVMARSDEGWRFGGGTFPFRPFGETAVILSDQDERRYRNPLG